VRGFGAVWTVFFIHTSIVFVVIDVTASGTTCSSSVAISDVRFSTDWNRDVLARSLPFYITLFFHNGSVEKIFRKSTASCIFPIRQLSMCLEGFFVRGTNNAPLCARKSSAMARPEANRSYQERMRPMLDDSVAPLIGSSPAMRALRSVIDRLARRDVAVLVQGASGTGKELVARAIHSGSKRFAGPFIDVNCAAITESLCESELFGHVRGAFTGAHRDHAGKFELAHRGTLFLDEIGEMPITLQAKFLRVLSDCTIVKVGGTRPIRIDFRLIAATNQDLEQMITTGQFRDDLYHRLNVCPIIVPPLRERLEDIPELVHHFLLRFIPETDLPVREFSAEVLRFFCKYSWPGNVRELENLVQRLIASSSKEIIELADLPVDFVRKVVIAKSAKIGLLQEAKRDLSYELCRYALAVTNGNHPQAARLLKVDRGNFHRMIKEHGLGGPPKL
jgi:transcriptional regulator with PAS, ATPase and Fis domain